MRSVVGFTRPRIYSPSSMTCFMTIVRLCSNIFSAFISPTKCPETPVPYPFRTLQILARKRMRARIHLKQKKRVKEVSECVCWGVVGFT